MNVLKTLFCRVATVRSGETFENRAAGGQPGAHTPDGLYAAHWVGSVVH